MKVKTSDKYILFIGLSAIENYPLLHKEIDAIRTELSPIINQIMQDVYQRKLTEIDEEKLILLIDSEISEQTWVNLIEHHGVEVQTWVLNSIMEYLYHLKDETLNFTLIHQAEKIAFLGNASFKIPIRFLVNLDQPKLNDINIEVGI